MEYDFSQLNDKEFESLSVDILSELYKTRIERFKSGKDRGIDGRFFTSVNKEIAIQCKHYLRTGYKGLISKLKKEEVEKIKRLNPERYIFVTSLPLSRDNKKEIVNIFNPYIKSESEVFGKEALNDLLAKNQQIEEKHFKLWISSTNVFKRIINNAIKGRSEFELEQIRNKSYKYIQTENHTIALNILKEKNVLLISGEPGIGKTTLAENLCLFFASKDFEFIDIEESLSEAENIYTPGKKQIFYFDDFLGSNYFEAIENKKDSHIVKFIYRIKNDKTKRLILTSRTNILNSGVMHSTSFSNSNIKKNEYMLTIGKLTAIDRAKILYNHIWFCNLTEEFIDEYYKDKRYMNVIRHKNFNPRLIEFITDIERISTVKSSDYWNYIVNTLENPKDIWNDCFKVQNNAFVRNLVKLTVFNGGTILEKDLRNSFSILNNQEKLKNFSHTEKDFKSTLQLSTKSFLNRNKLPSGEFYSLFNPSIADFVLNEYGNDFDSLINIFKSLNTVKSLEQLKALENSEIIPSEYASKIKNELFEHAFNENKITDYLIYISYLLLDDESKSAKIIELLKTIITEPVYIIEFSKFLILLSKFDEQLDIKDFKFLIGCINNRNLDQYEIEEFADFLEFYEIMDEDIISKLTEDIEDFLATELEFMKDDIDLSNHIVFSQGYDGEQEVDISEADIKQELVDLIYTIINDFNSDFINSLEMNIDNIINSIDLDRMINDFIISQEEQDFEGYGGGASNIDQDIDDLFERS